MTEEKLYKSLENWYNKLSTTDLFFVSDSIKKLLNMEFTIFPNEDKYAKALCRNAQELEKNLEKLDYSPREIYKKMQPYFTFIASAFPIAKLSVENTREGNLCFSLERITKGRTGIFFENKFYTTPHYTGKELTHLSVYNTEDLDDPRYIAFDISLTEKCVHQCTYMGSDIETITKINESSEMLNSLFKDDGETVFMFVTDEPRIINILDKLAGKSSVHSIYDPSNKTKR